MVNSKSVKSQDELAPFNMTEEHVVGNFDVQILSFTATDRPLREPKHLSFEV